MELLERARQVDCWEELVHVNNRGSSSRAAWKSSLGRLLGGARQCK